MRESGHSLYFRRMKNKEKINALKEKIAARDSRTRLKAHLGRIRRVAIEGTLDGKFGELTSALRGSEHFRRHYKDAYYRYEDIGGNPHLITGEKAVEETSHDIMNKDSQLYVIAERIQDVKAKLSERYGETRILEADGSVRVNLGWLSSEFLLFLESALLLMKSNIELYASFVEFLYPPMQQEPPPEMRDQIKYFSGPIGQELDAEYSAYLSNQMQWFQRLKLLRDATVHFGSFVFAMEETKEGNRVITLYPRRSHMLEERVLYQEIHQHIFAYLRFTEFYRAHFIKRLIDDNEAQESNAC